MLKEICERLFPGHKFNWKSSGNGYVGCCPFHDDHNPSFAVYTLDGANVERWRCMSQNCHGGGTDINLVLAAGIEGVSDYKSACSWLVENGFRMETPDDTLFRERSSAIMKFWEWTNELLRTSDNAAGLRAYLGARRKIDMNTLADAAVGYYPTVPEVESWLVDNDIAQDYWGEFIPPRGKEPLVTNGICFFYRCSFTEFGRIKVRKPLEEKPGSKSKIIYTLGGNTYKITTKKGEVRDTTYKFKGKTALNSFFCWNIDIPPTDHAFIVEGEFDAAVFASMVYRNDANASDPFFCFGGVDAMNKGIQGLGRIGITHMYIMPDNDEAGLKPLIKLSKDYPDSIYIIIPEDYEENQDPADWASTHDLKDYQAALNNAMHGYDFVGKHFISKYEQSVESERALIKKEFLDFASKLSPTTRETFINAYGPATGHSVEALMNELASMSLEKYRKVVSPLPAEYGMYERIETSKGVEWRRLSNFILEITRDLWYDDGNAGSRGENKLRKIELKASLPFKTCTFAVTAEEFVNNNTLESKIINNLSAAATPEPHSMDKISSACRSLSYAGEYGQNARETTIYTHMGWLCRPEKEDVFLMYDGYIDADGVHSYNDADFEVDINGGNTAAMYECYRVGNIPTPERLKELAAHMRANLLQVFDYEITLPYLAHMINPVIHRWAGTIGTRYAMWVTGVSGSFKTSFARTMMCFYGDFLKDVGNGFLSWTSSNAGTNAAAWPLKDVMLLIDDYKRCIADIEEKSKAILQSFGDSQGRTTSNPRHEVQTQKLLRCGLLSTGEDVPEDESSVLSRMLILRLYSRGRTMPLTEAQNNAEYMPDIFCGFIQFILKKKLDKAQIQKKKAEYSKQFEKTVVHPRARANIVTNMIAWDLWEEYLGFQDLRPYYERGLKLMAAGLNEDTQAQQASNLFIYSFSEMLDVGKIYLENADPRVFTQPPTPSSELVGWYDKDYTYINMSAAMRAINNFRKGVNGNGIQFSKRAILDQLYADEFIVLHQDGYNHGKKIHNSTKRVVWFKRGVLEHYYEEADNSEKLSECVLRDRRDSTSTEDAETEAKAHIPQSGCETDFV